jgi:hypothetical protein
MELGVVKINVALKLQGAAGRHSSKLACVHHEKGMKSAIRNLMSRDKGFRRKEMKLWGAVA